MQRLIGKMAPRYPMLITAGFATVITAFVIGIFNARTAAIYFATPKKIRETQLMAQHASIGSIDHWLPYLKFLGLGLILGGIIMALRVIIDHLKEAGNEVLSNLPPDQRAAMPDTPWYAKMMPLVMMLGETILVVALAGSFRVAQLVSSVFSNPNPVIDGAGAGSPILTQWQSVEALTSWLVPLKFVGLSTLFVAIVMGLMTIIYILNAQTQILDRSFGIARNRVNTQTA